MENKANKINFERLVGFTVKRRFYKDKKSQQQGFI